MREADELAQQMLEQRDVMRTILEEVLASAEDGEIRESGRTVCGSAKDPRGPLARKFTSVSLPTCPIRVGGAWHAHVTEGELKNPESSLPDVANVVFGKLEASIVVGTQSAEVVLAAEDRDAQVAAFQEALGVDVGSPHDVVNAVLSGAVNPSQARQRVRDTLSPRLVYRTDTGFEDLTREVEQLDVLEQQFVATATGRQPVPALMCYEYYHPARRSSTAPFSFEQQRATARNLCEPIERAETTVRESDIQILQPAVGAAIGVVVGRIVERALFGVAPA